MKARVLVFGAERVATKFDRMGADMLDAKPAFNKIADYMMEITDIQFRSQGRRGGGSWRRNNPGWAAYKRRHKKNPLILHQEHPNAGSLRRSVTVKRAKGSVRDIKKHSLNFGSDLPYAARHQFGVAGHTPARPFIKILQGDSTRIRNMMRDHLMQAWGRTR